MQCGWPTKKRLPAGPGTPRLATITFSPVQPTRRRLLPGMKYAPFSTLYILIAEYSLGRLLPSLLLLPVFYPVYFLMILYLILYFCIIFGDHMANRCSAMGSRFEVLWIEALEARDKNQLALDLARSGDPLGGDNTMNGSSKSGSSSAHPFAAMSIGEEGDDDASASSHASSLEGGPSSSGLVANTSSPANHPSGADVNFSVENGPYGGGNPTYSSGGGSNSGSSGSGSSSYGGTGGGATLHGLAPPSADALFETRFVATCIAAAASWASEDERVGTWPKNKREAFVQV